MVKFNYDACKQMDTILNTESKLKKAMVMVNNNLIDSNMFIRLGNNINEKFFPAVFCIQICRDLELLVSRSRIQFFLFFCGFGSYLVKTVKIVTEIFYEKTTALALETKLLNTLINFRPHFITFFAFF